MSEPDYLNQVDYQRRLQPSREAPISAAATILAAFAIVLGLGALWFAPLKLGTIALLLAIISLAISKGNDTMARWAFIIASFGWLIGTMLAVILDRNPL